ncbi:MAG: methionyl-tRNA formyltransferase [Planctomycetaceae bacterium]|nr:methionyl-tRNA formyltransferase [Planctomycetaceae bacterium]
MSLRLVLMGTGEFALPVFRTLIEGGEHVVAGVFTQPDRQGRGHHRHVNPVKQLAEQFHIPVFQPERVNRLDVLNQLRELTADVFLVAAYGQILKPELLAIPRLGAFNLHGSLLPRHRGAAPVQYSVWCGDQQTGVTIFQIEPALDSGPIIGRVTTDISPEDTSATLMLRLAELSIPLTLESLSRLESGTAEHIVQDASRVTLSPKLTRDDGIVNWNSPASAVDCQVRAMQPWPKASTWLHAPDHPPLRCILLKVDPAPEGSPSQSAAAGEVRIVGRRLFVQTSDRWLEILSIQPEGKRPMDAAGFLNGHTVPVGSRFSR